MSLLPGVFVSAAQSPPSSVGVNLSGTITSSNLNFSWTTPYTVYYYSNTSNSTVGGVLLGSNTTSNQAITVSHTPTLSNWYWSVVFASNAYGSSLGILSPVVQYTIFLPPNISGLTSFFSFHTGITDAYNAVTLTQTGSASYVSGRQGRSAIYLSNASVVNYLSATLSLGSDSTIVFWVNSQSFPGITGWMGGGTNGVALLVYQTSGIVWLGNGGANNGGCGIGTNTSTWYSFGITKTGGNSSFWLNGVQRGPALNSTIVNFTLGQGYNAYYANAYYQDLRIYNRVLSSAEMLAIYNDTG